MKRISFLVALALAACGPTVKSVTVDPPRAALDAKGAAVTLRATPRDDAGRPVADAKLRAAWTSSAPLVASVDDAGKVTALKSGEAVVTAAFGEVKGSAKIAVQIPAVAALTPAHIDFRGAGQTAALSLKVADDSGKVVAAPKGVAWATSDPAVAAVTGGQVTAVGPGTAVVTATLGTVTGEAQVTVKAPDFARLVLRPGRLSLARAGATRRLRAAALDRRGRPVAGVPFSWRSSNEGVARVDRDGKVTAGKKGKARITVSAGARSASAAVLVRR